MDLGRVLVCFGGVLMRLLVVARLMVRGGFVMMFGGLLMMFGALLVMLGCFVVCFDGHGGYLLWGVPRLASKHTANSPSTSCNEDSQSLHPTLI